MRISRVLADLWAELREAVRAAEVIHADETGWRLAGAQQWLWLAASALCACYRIDPSRSQAAAKELIGEDFGGFVISDRYAGYHFLDVLQQQLCWSHVIRQLVEVSERPGAAGKLGKQLVVLARDVIGAHRAYLEGGHDLAWLAAELAPLRQRTRALLGRGARGICSVRETSRLQGRSALDYLVEAAIAAHGRTPAPSLGPSMSTEARKGSASTSRHPVNGYAPSAGAHRST